MSRPYRILYAENMHARRSPQFRIDPPHAQRSAPAALVQLCRPVVSEAGQDCEFVRGAAWHSWSRAARKPATSATRPPADCPYARAATAPGDGNLPRRRPHRSRCAGAIHPPGAGRRQRGGDGCGAHSRRTGGSRCCLPAPPELARPGRAAMRAGPVPAAPPGPAPPLPRGASSPPRAAGRRAVSAARPAHATLHDGGKAQQSVAAALAAQGRDYGVLKRGGGAGAVAAATSGVGSSPAPDERLTTVAGPRECPGATGGGQAATMRPLLECGPGGLLCRLNRWVERTGGNAPAGAGAGVDQSRTAGGIPQWASYRHRTEAGGQQAPTVPAWPVG